MASLSTQAKTCCLWYGMVFGIVWFDVSCVKYAMVWCLVCFWHGMVCDMYTLSPWNGMVCGMFLHGKVWYGMCHLQQDPHN